MAAGQARRRRVRSVEVWLCYAAYASRHYQQEAATLSLLGELLVVKNRMPPCLRGMQARVWGSFGHVATPAARHGGGWLFVDGGRGQPSQSPQALRPWLADQVKSGRPSSGRTLGCRPTLFLAVQHVRSDVVLDLKTRQALEAEDLGGFCCCDCCHGIGCTSAERQPLLVPGGRRVGSLVLLVACGRPAVSEATAGQSSRIFLEPTTYGSHRQALGGDISVHVEKAVLASQGFCLPTYAGSDTRPILQHSWRCIRAVGKPLGSFSPLLFAATDADRSFAW